MCFAIVKWLPAGSLKVHKTCKSPQICDKMIENDYSSHTKHFRMTVPSYQNPVIAVGEISEEKLDFIGGGDHVMCQ